MSLLAAEIEICSREVMDGQVSLILPPNNPLSSADLLHDSTKCVQKLEHLLKEKQMTNDSCKRRSEPFVLHATRSLCYSVVFKQLLMSVTKHVVVTVKS